MTKKKELVRNQDQFLVRLPEGMRERIKAKAERAGMSMNEAIVHSLEHFFPATTTIDDKLNELAELVAILKGDNTNDGVERLIEAIRETLSKVGTDQIKAAPSFEKAVSKRYEQWQEWEAERIDNDAYNPFEDDRGSYFPSDEEIEAYVQQREDRRRQTARRIENAERLEVEDKATKPQK